jgi:hypothetical protein
MRFQPPANPPNVRRSRGRMGLGALAVLVIC